MKLLMGFFRGACVSRAVDVLLAADESDQLGPLLDRTLADAEALVQDCDLFLWRPRGALGAQFGSSFGLGHRTFFGIPIGLRLTVLVGGFVPPREPTEVNSRIACQFLVTHLIPPSLIRHHDGYLG